MAKKSKIVKNEKRREIVERYRDKVQELKDKVTTKHYKNFLEMHLRLV